MTDLESMRALMLEWRRRAEEAERELFVVKTKLEHIRLRDLARVHRSRERTRAAKKVNSEGGQ